MVQLLAQQRLGVGPWRLDFLGCGKRIGTIMRVSGPEKYPRNVGAPWTQWGKAQAELA